MLYAQVGKYLNQSIAVLKQMDYVEFFGLVRRVDVMVKQEQQAYDDAQARGRGNGNGHASATAERELTPEEFSQYIPHAQEWRGDVVSG